MAGVPVKGSISSRPAWAGPARSPRRARGRTRSVSISTEAPAFHPPRKVALLLKWSFRLEGRAAREVRDTARSRRARRRRRRLSHDPLGGSEERHAVIEVGVHDASAADEAALRAEVGVEAGDGVTEAEAAAVAHEHGLPQRAPSSRRRRACGSPPPARRGRRARRRRGARPPPPRGCWSAPSMRSVYTSPRRECAPMSRCTRRMLKSGWSRPVAEVSSPSTARRAATRVPATLPVSLAAPTGATTRRV